MVIEELHPKLDVCFDKSVKFISLINLFLSLVPTAGATLIFEVELLKIERRDGDEL